MFIKFYRTLLFIMISILLARAATAQLLVNHSGGTVLFDDSSLYDDATVNRTLGFTGSFFGVNRDAVDVSVNGNLNTTGDVSGYNLGMPDSFFGVARISALWDNLQISPGSGGSVIENKQDGVYYSVTWKNLEANPGSQERHTFQVVWFGSAATVAGHSFSANDIAFAYEKVDAAFADSIGDEGAAVGLDKGDGTTYSPLPGTPLNNGVVTDDTKYLLPVNNEQFILFRPDGNGSYNVSVVPAPNSLITTILGGTLLWLKQLLSLFFKRISSLPKPE